MTATHPAGPWTEPHLMQAGRGLIDPCPLWDDDGHAYLVHAYAFSRAGFCHKLRVCEMAMDGSRLLDEGQIVFDAPGRQPTIEGPKFLKRDGWYYILAPAGGVQTGWQTVLRSKNIFGPYEEKIVLEQGRTPINGPHQGALVDTPNGEWWFIHFQDAGVYGRVTHLQPVRWVDGWPLMGRDHDGNGIGEPVSHFQKPAIATPVEIRAPQSSDEFDAPQLGLQWQWHANHEGDWCSLTARKGWLRLFARPVANNDLAKTPNLLLQKCPARSFVVETTVESNATEAGLVVMGRTWSALAVRRDGKQHQLVRRGGDGEIILCDLAPGLVTLRLELSDGGGCAFSFRSARDEWLRAPGDFQATAGVWISAKVGIYCLAIDGAPDEFADFDYFRFAAPTKSLA
jgi:beta-xylosidase